ncbi:hypothetical protein BJ165DRAFT_1531925 [Panaeolus papilionaceus]|nr:hypothetical protein BJ165DRAFT_1531925 [Panaeolus papilionaceus]
MSAPFQKTQDFAQHVDERLTDRVDNPLRSTEQTVEATKNVISDHSSQRGGPHSRKAQKVVFAKGLFDVGLSLSLLFFPSLLYDGLLATVVSKLTALPLLDSHQDPQSAFALAALIMGAGIAGIAAAESSSDDAFKVIATLNGVFAGISLMGCLLSPYNFGSSFLLLAGLQDVFWFFSIISAGKYDPLETLGISWKAVAREKQVIRRRDEAIGEKKTGGKDKPEGSQTGMTYNAKEVDDGSQRTTHLN